LRRAGDRVTPGYEVAVGCEASGFDPGLALGGVYRFVILIRENWRPSLPIPEETVVARILIAGVALMMLGASGGALACQVKAAAVLDDTFKTPDPGWGAPDDAASFSSAGLLLKPPVNGSAWRWNPNYAIDGASLCVTVTNPSPLPDRAALGDVGVRFWSKDAQNFYTATVSLDGSVAIDRLVNGIWHVVLPPTPSGAVRTRAGAVNEVQVTVRGDSGTFYVNGSKIADFRGDAPPRGGPPGVYAESGNAGVTWIFPRVQLF
jgi:hypothetical protein